MNIGGGEAADQMVRMMLSSGEVVVRLGGSALKNLLALSLALAKNHKKLSGKVNLTKMLKETRDIRQFPMSSEQYRQFRKLAEKQKILFSTIRDKDGGGERVDVLIPVTDMERANQVFSRILYASERETTEDRQRQEDTQKKGHRSGRDSHDIRHSSDTPSRTAEMETSERPSVETRLKGYQEQLQRQRESAPTKTKTKNWTKEK